MQAVAALSRSGVSTDHGLTADELAAVQAEFGIRFNVDHAAFLSAGVPVSEGWPDWRHGDRAQLRKWLDWPIDGVIWDVLNNDFWPRSWGRRPLRATAREAAARDQLGSIATLIPVYSHRFAPSADAAHGAPIFSVYQTDVIVYGDNFVDYLQHEGGVENRPRPETIWRVQFWSELADGDPDFVKSGPQKFWNRSASGGSGPLPPGDYTVNRG